MKNMFSIISKAGLIVGTLDILAAILHYFIRTGKGPSNILKYIASGLFGRAAFSGGTEMLLAGLLLHYVIAFVFTALFFLIYPGMKFISGHPVMAGILYGVFVWAIMNLVVVPLSRIPARPMTAMNVLINAVILIVCIGLPLSFMARAYFNRPFRQVP